VLHPCDPASAPDPVRGQVRRPARLRPLVNVAICALSAAAAAGAVAGCGRAESAKRPSAHAVTFAGAGPLIPAGADWPTLLHGPSHFGAATVAGPATAAVRWQRRLAGSITPGPVTVGGVAYVASNGGVLHALSVATGKDLWSFSGGAGYGSDLSTAPAVLGDRLILWPGPHERVFALSPLGRLRWTIQLQGQALTPAVDPARRLLVVADASCGLRGYRLALGGAAPVRVWSHPLATASFGNPVLASNGTTYETAGDSLYAVSAAGHVLWRVKTPAQVEVSAAVADDGTIVFGSGDQREYGVWPDGRLRWRVAIGNYTYSSPLTLAGHRVVFGDHSGDMSTLDTRDGHLISRDHGSGQLWTAAAVDHRGDIYFASRTGGIYGFGPHGQRLFRLPTGATFDSYPAIAADGTLLVGGDDGVPARDQMTAANEP